MTARITSGHPKMRRVSSRMISTAMAPSTVLNGVIMPGCKHDHRIADEDVKADPEAEQRQRIVVDGDPVARRALGRRKNQKTAGEDQAVKQAEKLLPVKGEVAPENRTGR